MTRLVSVDQVDDLCVAAGMTRDPKRPEKWEHPTGALAIVTHERGRVYRVEVYRDDIHPVGEVAGGMSVGLLNTMISDAIRFAENTDRFLAELAYAALPPMPDSHRAAAQQGPDLNAPPDDIRRLTARAGGCANCRTTDPDRHVVPRTPDMDIRPVLLCDLCAVSIGNPDLLAELREGERS